MQSDVTRLTLIILVLLQALQWRSTAAGDGDDTATLNDFFGGLGRRPAPPHYCSSDGGLRGSVAAVASMGQHSAEHFTAVNDYVDFTPPKVELAVRPGPPRAHLDSSLMLILLQHENVWPAKAISGEIGIDLGEILTVLDAQLCAALRLCAANASVDVASREHILATEIVRPVQSEVCFWGNKP